MSAGRAGRVRFLLCTLLVGLPVFGRTWVVGPDGQAGDSLQAAIDAAGSRPGVDTVLVRDGTYHVVVNPDVIVFGTDTIRGFAGLRLRDSVVLRSEHGPADCILTAAGVGPDTAWHVILARRITGARIEGFTIRDGRSFHLYWGQTIGPDSTNAWGGGVDIVCAEVALENNWLLGNRATSGAAVMAADTSRVTVTGNTMRGNTSYWNGGGILLYRRVQGVLTGNTVADNVTLGDGGGILISMSNATLIRNTVTGNEGGYGGGGVHPASSYVALYDNIIRGNRALHGGGIWLLHGGSYYFARNRIENNVAVRAGGGIAITRSHGTFEGNIIRGNIAPKGGGLWVNGTSWATLNRDLVAGNVATGEGGGINCNTNSSAALRACVLAANRSRVGAACYDSLQSRITVDSCLVVDNATTDEQGAGLAYVAGNADSGVTLQISNSNLYYNPYPPGVQVENRSDRPLQLQDNFWQYGTESEIAFWLRGPNTHDRWRLGSIPGASGEPAAVDSIRAYNQSYGSVIERLVDPDALYLRLFARGRHPDRCEAAVVILRSDVRPGGIAVALVETDTNSGVYEGRAVVARDSVPDPGWLDEVRSCIRVNAIGDEVSIRANTDSTAQWTVAYRRGSPDLVFLAASRPNPFRVGTVIEYRLPARARVAIDVYDHVGRCRESRDLGIQELGWHGFNWDWRLPSGVYFCRVRADAATVTCKVVVIR